MAETGDHLRTVAQVVKGLRGLGFQPGDRLTPLVGVFYDCSLELVSRLDDAGNATATIDNRRVAAIRLRIDAPASACFFDVTTGLRIDLLFNFPLPVAGLAKHAARLTIRKHALLVASEGDLLQLKKIAAAARSVPGDADDIAFLESRQRRRTSP
jgi:hypothetical protein